MGDAYIRRGLSTEGNLRFQIDWASLIVGSIFSIFLCFTLYLRAIFCKYKLPGGLYLEGRFNGGFFALPLWGGLYLEGLKYGGAYFRNFTVFFVRLCFLRLPDPTHVFFELTSLAFSFAYVENRQAVNSLAGYMVIGDTRFFLIR